MDSSYCKSQEILTEFDHQVATNWSQVSILEAVAHWCTILIQIHDYVLPDFDLEGVVH